MAATFPVPLRTGGRLNDYGTVHRISDEYVLNKLYRAVKAAQARRRARQVAVATGVAITCLAALVVIVVVSLGAQDQRNHLSSDIPPDERLRISANSASNLYSAFNSTPNFTAAQVSTAPPVTAEVTQTSTAAVSAAIEIPAATGPAQVCASVVKLLVDAAEELRGSPLLSTLEVQPDSYFCRRFPTAHTNTSQGYLLYSQRRKLKAELLGKSQEEIRELRLAGEDVTDTISVPEIAFTGDITAGFLDGLSDPTLEDALKARVLVMEMTFVSADVTVDEGRENGHMHIADFVAHAHRFQNEAIVLIHFSPRYKRTDIITALNTMLPPSLKAKCIPLLNGIE